MTRYKITVAYDGTDYAGWQVQPKNVTVQQTIRDAVIRISGETVVIHGSGRTDRGVHARGQVAHFDLSKPVKTASFKRSLNAVLPDDIRINKMAVAAEDFHSRVTVASKEYRYFIWNAAVVPPTKRLYVAQVRDKLDIPAMRKAAKALEGKHDFAAFTANASRPPESTTRDVTSLDVRKKGSEVVIIARGSGFLYKMVRSLAGFLIRVGKGEFDPGAAKEVLKTRRRTQHVPTAPPQGLFLWEVNY